MGTREIFISEKDFDFIEERLGGLLVKTAARCAMLVDKSGHLVMARGDFHKTPPNDLGVMAAGAISALCNMSEAAPAHLTAQYHDPGSESIHFALINSNLFLVVFFTTSAENASAGNEVILSESRLFVRNIKPLLFNKGGDIQGWGSLSHIMEKIDNIFDKDTR